MQSNPAPRFNVRRTAPGRARVVPRALHERASDAGVKPCASAGRDSRLSSDSARAAQRHAPAVPPRRSIPGARVATTRTARPVRPRPAVPRTHRRNEIRDRESRQPLRATACQFACDDPTRSWCSATSTALVAIVPTAAMPAKLGARQIQWRSGKFARCAAAAANSASRMTTSRIEHHRLPLGDVGEGECAHEVQDDTREEAARDERQRERAERRRLFDLPGDRVSREVADHVTLRTAPGSMQPEQRDRQGLGTCSTPADRTRARLRPPCSCVPSAQPPAPSPGRYSPRGGPPLLFSQRRRRNVSWGRLSGALGVLCALGVAVALRPAGGVAAVALNHSDHCEAQSEIRHARTPAPPAPRGQRRCCARHGERREPGAGDP